MTTPDALLPTLREALEADPLSACTWTALGTLHASRGETGSAVAALRRATAIDPSHRDARASLEALGVEPEAAASRAFTLLTVRPPGYVHARALDELAETLHVGLLGLGHDSRMRAAPDAPSRTHIVLGAHLLERSPLDLPPDAILFNTEQIHPACPWLTPSYLKLLQAHAVWDYSAANVTSLRKLGVSRATHVPVGHVEELNRIPAGEVEDVDVLFAGSTNDRRAYVLDALKARGLRVKELFGVYGTERDAWIARAKIALNVRFYHAGPFEIVRVAYLLSNARFVVSEAPSSVDDEEAHRGGVVFAPYERLVDTCIEHLERAEDRASVSANALDLMRRRPMRDILRAALEGECPRSDWGAGAAGGSPQDRDVDFSFPPLPRG